MTPVRPILVASLCLGASPVRHDGQALRNPFLARLAPFVELRPVCPEVEIGLGVPRPAVRIAIEEGQPRLVQPSTGRDVTDAMRGFSDKFLDRSGAVDGFLLKSRSPSCGVRDAKAYAGSTPASRGPGLFAAAVLDRYPEAAVEDEGRMTNLRIREHFLTRLFAHAELRQVRRMGDLVRFHARHKFLLLACAETHLRALGRVVANPQRHPFPDVRHEYATRFRKALSHPPRTSTWINVLQHVMGFFSKVLSPDEKSFFLGCLDEYRNARVPLSAPLMLLRAWLSRRPHPYLADQAFFTPFPPALIDPSDSAQGRGSGLEAC